MRKLSSLKANMNRNLVRIGLDVNVFLKGGMVSSMTDSSY